jgi:hypothetical protein
MTDDVLFYGVATGTRSGHYLYRPGRGGPMAVSVRKVEDLPADLHRIDGVWTAPRPRTEDEVRDRTWKSGGEEIQGVAHIHFVQGWTIVAWWDRSEDRRGGCNANFIARGRCRFEGMLRLAREHFPAEMQRMERAYPICLASGDLPESSNEDAAMVFVESFQSQLDALHPEVRAAALPVLHARLRRAHAHG